MSLINDALKRASQSDRNRPSQAAPPRPMQPAAAGSGSRLPAILSLVVAAVLALSAWFFSEWWKTSHPVATAKPSPPPAAKVTVPPPPPPPPVPAAKSEAPPLPVPTAVAPEKPAEPISEAPVVEPAWPTPLTLQGIFYSKTRPFALINGKTVEPGQSISNVVVTKIEPTRVTVEWNGNSKSLSLDGQ